MPTKFLDGPAAGQTLCICRAPIFLRVVRNRSGEWDCLDQLHDMPELTEAIFVYRRVQGAANPTVHICGRRNGKRWGGFFCMADYVYHDPQPDDDTARSPGKWPKWCEEQLQAMKAS